MIEYIVLIKKKKGLGTDLLSYFFTFVTSGKILPLEQILHLLMRWKGTDLYVNHSFYWHGKQLIVCSASPY